MKKRLSMERLSHPHNVPEDYSLTFAADSLDAAHHSGIIIEVKFLPAKKFPFSLFKGLGRGIVFCGREFQWETLERNGPGVLKFGNFGGEGEEDGFGAC